LDRLQDLRDFLEMAKAHGKVLVLQHWELREIKNGKADVGHDEIERLCQEMGVTCASLAPWYEQAISSGETLYLDNIHPNDAGQKVIAEVIYHTLYPDTQE
jgi:lysophospholipase L1-like esterase